MKIQSLTFDVVSGGSKHELKTDGNQPYPTAHWYDADVDGNTSEAGDHRSPVAYKRASTMKVDATFTLATGVSPSGVVKIKGVGPGTLTFDTDDPTGQPVATSASGSVSIAGLVCKNAFNNTVDFFGTDGYLDISWQVSLDGGNTWAQAGRTRNQVYVLYDNPTSGLNLFHTLIHLGCKNAKGDATPGSITGHVWQEFTDRDVRRVDGYQLTYYKSYLTSAQTTASLLSTGDGQCGSWAKFFLDIRRAQGLLESDNYVTFGSVGEYMLIANWSPVGTGTKVVQNYPYLMVDYGTGLNAASNGYSFIYTEMHDAVGVPGQGTSNPRANFVNHQVVKIAGIYYDPSYGAAYFSLQDIEDAVVFGFYVSAEVTLNEATYNVDFNFDGDKVDSLTGNAGVARLNSFFDTDELSEVIASYPF